jgi:2'-5' RNA ligase
MAPEQYHVTLRFLGPVAVARVPAVEDAVLRCALDSAPAPVSVGRGGGTTRRSEVAWLELAEGADRVSRLADRLDAILPVDVLGEQPRARPTPHLTIARRVSQALVDELHAARWGGVHEAWLADRLVLFRSFTGTPTGSRYEVLVEAPLGRAAGSGPVAQPTHRGAA